jgi:AAA+ ATPase superfamily predicted ATPase
MFWCGVYSDRMEALNYIIGVAVSELFVGREAEIQELTDLQHKNTASLVVVQGRRRIGKSRLIEEFAKNQKFYSIAGLAPTKETTAQMQRDEFARQLGEQLDIPKFSMSDWGDLFTLLAKNTEKGKVVILLDEISWMGSLDSTFLGKLKNAWDTQFKKNPKLMLVLCGSVSAWIEKNIISNTLFLGRPSWYIKLPQLSVTDCDEFWGAYRERISAYEKLKVLSITGGVPRYLELVNPNKSAEDNIRALCFSPNAPLLNEFERIFADIFGERSELYKKIIDRLMDGPASQEEILISCGRSKTGDFSEYLKDLDTAGFISRDFTWHLKDGKTSKLSRYRLKDNYVRFYLKYIQPNKTKIEKGVFKKTSITTLSGWESIISLQFENLVLNNDACIVELLGVPAEEIVFSNPYFQKKTKTHPGCQIDLLIQTKFNSLYVCEIKFSRSEVTASVVEEVKQKINRLNIPKNFSYRPVLIHVNGVNEAVVESGYFAKIIDFGQLLSGR